ncbi:MAG: UDP-N-acetylmuramate dehydrogenase [Candidatus Omnitrophica bacterium]|nr:UDP-N-acetylmuramate dehydrogenase [Candidatus Omnitrophota bacterium]
MPNKKQFPCESIAFERSRSLKDFTTLRLGGNCRGVLSCHSEEELIRAIETLNQNKEKFVVIGAGSNILVSDFGFNSFVIRYISAKPEIKKARDCIIVSGSTLLDDLASYACLYSLGGINFASGIPGTVGGAIVGNAGAYGRQMSDILESVTVVDINGKKHDLKKQYLRFGYRHSILKENGAIVLSVKIKLPKEKKSELIKEREYIMMERSLKHPNWRKIPTAGSFFKNIEPTSKAGLRKSAGWFLEQAGCKKLNVNGAKVFAKHANIVLTENKNTTSQDVYDLSLKMFYAVKKMFNIELVREVRLLGDFKGKPKETTSLIW